MNNSDSEELKVQYLKVLELEEAVSMQGLLYELSQNDARTDNVEDGYSHIDSDDLEFSETEVEGNTDTIDEIWNYTVEDEIYHISPDELENASPEQLIAILSKLIEKNKDKQQDLDNTLGIKKILISKIIAAQQEGRVLDEQIRNAKAQNRGE